MKSVVMIAYFFPPEGNAGSYRPLRFIRHLPSLGWQPSVVTLDTESYERYDFALQTAIPKGIDIVHARNGDIWQAFQAWRKQRARVKGGYASAKRLDKMPCAKEALLRRHVRALIRRAEAWCYHPDEARGWIQPAVAATIRLSRRKKPVVLWATAGPVSSFVAARRASQQSGIPYVLDFRDAWTLTYNEFEDRQPSWAQRRAYRSMYSLLKHARAVVFRYGTEAECFWQAYPNALNVDRVHIIPNGFDGDIEPYEASSAVERCRILYTGTLGDYRYDTLLTALRTLKQESPHLAKCFDLQFVGEDNHKLREVAAALDLSDIVSTSGAVGFDKVNQISRDAHALLVLGRYPTMRGYELFAPAKLFGYLKSGRPIIGVLPEDEAKTILLQVGVTTVANVESVPDIIAVLRCVLQTWESGQLASLVPIADKCRAFSASHQTRLLVAALDGKPADHPFVPGRETVPPSLRDAIKLRQLEAEHLGRRAVRQDLAMP